jgi:hypothetical protein
MHGLGRVQRTCTCTLSRTGALRPKKGSLSAVLDGRSGELTATDYWHYLKGFCHNVRAAKSFLWHKEHGLRDIMISCLPKEFRQEVA